jgi:two-component system, NarL family, nitrate/nitrite response regulator NarL
MPPAVHTEPHLTGAMGTGTQDLWRLLPESGEGVRESPIDVFIVAGVRLYEDGLAQALSANPRLRVVGTAPDDQTGTLRLATLPRCPDVALIDVRPPAGFGTARALRVAAPGMRLLALAVSDRAEDVVGWAESGVSGFVTHDTPLRGLVQAVEAVASTGCAAPPSVTSTLLRRMEAMAAGNPADPDPKRLTHRENEIVALIDRGLSNKQIAAELNLSLATVKNHVHSILDKLNVDRRGEAAAAVRNRARWDRPALISS